MDFFTSLSVGAATSGGDGGGRRGRSIRVSMEDIAEDIQVNLDELLPARHPPKWTHLWLKSYHDDHLIYASLWDAKSPESRKGLVVFLHATTLHAHFYDNLLLRPLARAGFVVCAFDRRGHGRTGKANRGSFGKHGEHGARLTDIATVIDAAVNKYPGLPLLLAGHGLGAAEVLAFCARWSKSQQARCVRGILAFAPGFGEVKFACDARKLHDSLSPVYNSLVLVGTVSAESVADPQSIGLVAAAARKLLRRYGDIKSGMVEESLLERCLNAALKLDIEDEAVHALFKLMDPEGLAARIDIEELIWAIIQAGAPDEFLSSKAIVETPQIDTFLAQIFKTRGGDIKPPLFWSHGTGDKVLKLGCGAQLHMLVVPELYENSVISVNTPIWAEEIIRSCGASDAEIKLHHDLRLGVFTDEDASVVLKEAMDWMEGIVAAGGQAGLEVASGSCEDQPSTGLGVFSSFMS